MPTIRARARFSRSRCKPSRGDLPICWVRARPYFQRVSAIVRAAGGVIFDPTRKGRFLVVHRPKYDDWSFPKGKLKGAESPAQAALREVREETGFECELVDELTPVHYVTRHRNLKVVNYWLMRPIHGSFQINPEVDTVTWLKRNQALSLLSYSYDHAVAVEAAVRLKDRRRALKLAAKEALAGLTELA